MSKKEVVAFIAKACFAGVAIGFGAVASLLANSLLAGLAGKLVGGCLFTVGMFIIISYDMRLFTGMVASVPDLGAKNLWRLPLCFFCNAVGIGVVAVLARFSFSGDALAAQAASLMQSKLNNDLWYVKDFCSAVLCGVLITFSVRSVQAAPRKGLNPTLGVVFPIAVFAFCGFDHSVANMLYFYYLGDISWKIVGYILITVIGNFLGGAFFPFAVWVVRRQRALQGDGAAEKVANAANAATDTPKDEEDSDKDGKHAGMSEKSLTAQPFGSSDTAIKS